MTARSPHLENGFLRAALAAEEESDEGSAQLFDVRIDVDARMLLPRRAPSPSVVEPSFLRTPHRTPHTTLSSPQVDDLEPLEALARYGRSNVAFQRLAYAQVRRAIALLVAAFCLAHTPPRGRLSRSEPPGVLSSRAFAARAATRLAVCVRGSNAVATSS